MSLPSWKELDKAPLPVLVKPIAINNNEFIIVPRGFEEGACIYKFSTYSNEWSSVLDYRAISRPKCSNTSFRAAIDKDRQIVYVSNRNYFFEIDLRQRRIGSMHVTTPNKSAHLLNIGDVVHVVDGEGHYTLNKQTKRVSTVARTLLSNAPRSTILCGYVRTPSCDAAVFVESANVILVFGEIPLISYDAYCGERIIRGGLKGDMSRQHRTETCLRICRDMSPVYTRLDHQHPQTD